MDKSTEKQLMDSLQKTLTYRLKNELKRTHVGKKHIPQLKVELQARRTLPRGIFSETEKNVGVRAGELDKLMKRMKVKPISHYQQFIQQEFENLAAEVQQEISKPAEQTKDDEGIMSITSKGTEGTKIEIEEEDDDEDQIRTISYLFQSLLREGLPEDIRQTFIDTLEATVRSSSDYIIAYSIQVQKFISLFQNNTFEQRPDSSIVLTPKVGCLISGILPDGFSTYSTSVID